MTQRDEFEAWWGNFSSDHEDWKFADSGALRWAAWQAAQLVQPIADQPIQFKPVMTDEQILELWSGAGQRPTLGKNKVLTFAHAILADSTKGDMTFEQWWDFYARTPAPNTYKNWEESCRLAWVAAQSSQPVQQEPEIAYRYRLKGDLQRQYTELVKQAPTSSEVQKLYVQSALAQPVQPAPHAMMDITDMFQLESMTPVEGYDEIYRHYATTFGRTPDAFMQKVVGETKERLLMWWGAHREAVREALVAHEAAALAQPVQPEPEFNRRSAELAGKHLYGFAPELSQSDAFCKGARYGFEERALAAVLTDAAQPATADTVGKTLADAHGTGA